MMYHFYDILKRRRERMKTGLVLEGGGMRGVYTAGVLRGLIDRGLWVDYVIGVSAGATNAANFVSRQAERLWSSTGALARDKRYMGVGSWLKTGSYMNMDFTFNVLANELDPFDYDTFRASPTEMMTVVTNAETGVVEYHPKADIPRGDYRLLMASSSLPVFSPPVDIDGAVYYDGGVVDPIPVERALADGCDRVIVVLTQPEGYQKGPQKGKHIYPIILRKYPKITEILRRRHETYNKLLLRVKELEKAGVALVLRPSRDTGVKRASRDEAVLREAYALGLEDLEAAGDRLPLFTSGGAV